MCLATVFAVGVLVGLVAWIVCWRMFLILCYFQFPSVCGGCVCSGGSSGTASVDFVLNDVSNTMFFFFCFLVCLATVFAVEVLVGLLAWIVC